jgi:hypothetical protein
MSCIEELRIQRTYHERKCIELEYGHDLLFVDRRARREYLRHCEQFKHLSQAIEKILVDRFAPCDMIS